MSARISVRCRVLAGVVVVPSWLAACGGGGSGGGFDGIPGSEQDKPGGGTFLLDPHRGGQASRLHLLESQWGRLVDVHGLLEDDSVDPIPVYREMLIDEAIQTDALDYRLETNAITQRTRLVILRRRGEPDTGQGTFGSLL